jgi:hypothetical protein
MMAVFYSEGMRKLLLERVKPWNGKGIQSKQIMHDIVKKNYTHVNHEYMTFFDQFKPEVLLKALHVDKPEIFDFDPDKGQGYFSGRYLYKLLRYIGVEDFAILDAIQSDKDSYKVYYGQYNVLMTKIGDPNYKGFGKASPETTTQYLKRTPDVLLVMTKRSSDIQFYPQHYFKTNLTFDEHIQYNNVEYIADSMIISNFNQHMCQKGHEICGITCGKKRFMYNGWMQKSVDKGITNTMFNHVPCALMPHDWLDRSKPAFCIDHKQCDLAYHDNAKKYQNDMCFAYNKGPRIYVYIRADLLKRKYTKKTQHTDAKVTTCPEGKVLNPKTGRCVKIAIKKVVPSAQCPEDKVLNPKTGKCVLITGKVGQEIIKSLCPPDKVYNPKTKKCLKKDGKAAKLLAIKSVLVQK